MRGDSRASEYTRCLAREIYCSEITRVRQTPLLSLSFLVFLVDGRSSVSSFGYQLSTLHGARLRVSFLLFSFHSTHFLFLWSHSLRERRAKDKSPFDRHELRMLNFIYTTRFFDQLILILDILFVLISRCHINVNQNQCQFSLYHRYIFLLYFWTLFVIFKCFALIISFTRRKIY